MWESGDDPRRSAMDQHSTWILILISASFVGMLCVGFWTRGSVLFGLILPPVVLIAIMLGYRGYCLDKLGLSAEETGDSLYFLGFLFTATSLSAGIIVIGILLQGGHDQTTASDAIISFLPTFGAALATTIVGLCLRVVMSQGAGDIDTDYSDMKVQLHQAAADLSQQANLTTDQFAQLMTVLKQKTQEVQTGFVGFSNALRVSFEESGVRQVADRMEQSATALGIAADEFRRSADTVNTRLGPALTHLSEASRDLRDRSETSYSNLTYVVDRLEESSAAGARVLADQATLMGELSAKIGNIDMGAIALILQQSTEALQMVAVEFRNSVSEVGTKLEPVVERLAVASDDLGQQSATAMVQLTNAISRWEESMEFRTGALEAQTQALAGLANRIGDVDAPVAESRPDSVQDTVTHAARDGLYAFGFLAAVMAAWWCVSSVWAFLSS